MLKTEWRAGKSEAAEKMRMKKYEFVTISGHGFVHEAFDSHREIINEYASHGYRYVGFIPTKETNAFIVEMDLIFEKDIDEQVGEKMKEEKMMQQDTKQLADETLQNVNGGHGNNGKPTLPLWDEASAGLIADPAHPGSGTVSANLLDSRKITED